MNNVVEEHPIPGSIHNPSMTVRNTIRHEAPKLSARETEVLLGWLKCDSKEVLATQLFLSLGTVNTHLARIREKYSAKGRPAPSKSALLARALQDGLITIDDLD
ncbi:LuxR C-terminal-related transcriptional regulator [Rhodococcus sp. T7]|uniref:LuxR C-terminal-related transcriptional regulator n=1 Tax=Rhodococcus sp. T7 TaxID=627444 RepID=UPI001F215B79|nr:LuxR C-terminal-related transcriptional regulator [Rhodococcus sp. T7]